MKIISPTLASDIAAIWPDLRPTPLIDLPRVATEIGVRRIFAKIEAARPLGNFKSLGGTLAGLRALARVAGAATIAEMLARPLPSGGLPRLLCASDGNHGLSVAAAAKWAGTDATIFLPVGVDPVRAARIEALGGQVRRVPGTYDQAILAASHAAESGQGLLIPDTTQDASDRVVQEVMAGYSVITDELRAHFDRIDDTPTHAFIQAGVGGLAAAIADGGCGGTHLAVVEPESAACVAAALHAGRPVLVDGALETSAEMLSCGLASTPALEVLLRHGAHSLLVGEEDLSRAVGCFGREGVQTTPSGAAGLAGLLRAANDEDFRRMHGLNSDSLILLIVTEKSEP